MKHTIEFEYNANPELVTFRITSMPAAFFQAGRLTEHTVCGWHFHSVGNAYIQFSERDNCGGLWLPASPGALSESYTVPSAIWYDSLMPALYRFQDILKYPWTGSECKQTLTLTAYGRYIQQLIRAHGEYPVNHINLECKVANKSEGESMKVKAAVIKQKLETAQNEVNNLCAGATASIPGRTVAVLQQLLNSEPVTDTAITVPNPASVKQINDIYDLLTTRCELCAEPDGIVDVKALSDGITTSLESLFNSQEVFKALAKQTVAVSLK